MRGACTTPGQPSQVFPLWGPVLGWPGPCGSDYEPQDARQQKPLGNFEEQESLLTVLEGKRHS